ncbi:hypothetical protein C8J56DRAFT_768397, partial [Mycena floridula]
IEASNRYFTRWNDIGSLSPLPLGPKIDPHGYLAQAAGSEFMYAEDNKVTCFRQTSDKSGEVRYEPMHLSELRKGAVVELRISLVGVMMGRVPQKHPKVLVVLRAVHLLNERYVQVSSIGSARIADFMNVNIGHEQSDATNMRRISTR